jgi:hypothetical protein
MTKKLDRREFVKLAGSAGAVLAARGWPSAPAFQQNEAPGPDAAERDLVLLALDAVRSAGASYADVRVQRGLFEGICGNA